MWRNASEDRKTVGMNETTEIQMKNDQSQAEVGIFCFVSEMRKDKLVYVCTHLEDL